MPAVRLDGTLEHWDEVREEIEWAVLLTGNGLSVNMWPAFDYGSLFENAAGLASRDLALFADTPNFERVLSDLGTAIRVSEVVGVDAGKLYARYRRIQRALGHAIREVHPHRTDISDEALSAIRTELLNYEWIFTTSYDLIIYWAMGRGPRDTFTPFIDHLRGPRLEFNPQRATVYANEVPVYFLHGALHLVVSGTGVTWKIRRNLLQTLLDQFGEPIAGDPQARPLLVTEGAPRDKLTSIEGNDYLSHALATFSEVDLPLVVFGSSLSAEDQHLIDALNETANRPVAISMRPGPRRQLAAKQADIFGRLTAEDIWFFDSTTHPLGADLSATA